MNHKKAEKKALKVKWKTITCGSGNKCWCRVIIPVKPISYKDDFEDGKEKLFQVVGSGELEKKLAEYFVKLHNKSLKK